ncbi:hypothetical protein VNO77_31137 [Canavalia gladiata]|uniref:Uncharacterized protein n=1 Tax=Canavalia gladiata TaxID=3824 RepID=A0AAN9Q7K9_CANGL
MWLRMARLLCWGTTLISYSVIGVLRDSRTNNLPSKTLLQGRHAQGHVDSYAYSREEGVEVHFIGTLLLQLECLIGKSCAGVHHHTKSLLSSRAIPATNDLPTEPTRAHATHIRLVGSFCEVLAYLV